MQVATSKVIVVGLEACFKVPFNKHFALHVMTDVLNFLCVDSQLQKLNCHLIC